MYINIYIYIYMYIFMYLYIYAYIYITKNFETLVNIFSKNVYIRVLNKFFAINIQWLTSIISYEFGV